MCFQYGFSQSCQQPINNILITAYTPWDNLIVEMCPGQKIIVSPGVLFSINNTTIRLKSGETGQWQGIELGVGSSITLGSGSKIQSAQNAISAVNGCNLINIVSSEISANVTAITVGNSNLQAKGNIYIFESRIIMPQGGNAIFSNGANIEITNNSRIQGSGGSVGISSLNNKVSIMNSKVTGFAQAIFKGIGGFRSNRGLYVFHSYIAGQAAINNSDALIDVQFSYINGRIDCIGRSIGNWHANNFGNGVVLRNSMFSQRFSENFFHNSTLNLNLNQKLTFADCNTWSCGSGITRINSSPCNSSTNVVDGFTATMLPIAWIASGPLQPDGPSGNKWVGNKPGMISSAAGFTTNYYYKFDDNQIFNYIQKFKGRDYEDNENEACSYDLFPMEINFEPALIPKVIPTYDDIANNQMYNSLIQLENNINNQIANSTGEELIALQIKLESIQNAKGQSVLLALMNENSTMSEPSYNTWISRADPILEI